MSDAAKTLVDNHLASCLPVGCPPCHRLVIKARFVGVGKKSVAIADVEMFDGQAAKIEVFRWGLGGLGHRWTEMAGGCAFYEDGRWQRETEGVES